MRFFLIFIPTILSFYAGYGQLRFITKADTSAYYSRELACTVYPNLGLVQRGESIYQNGYLIFDAKQIPKGYLSYHLEVFNDQFLVLTFKKWEDRGISNPALLKRKHMLVFDLQDIGQPKSIHLGGIRLITGNYDIHSLQLPANYEIYAIAQMDAKQLKLLMANGKTRSIKWNTN